MKTNQEQIKAAKKMCLKLTGHILTTIQGNCTDCDYIVAFLHARDAGIRAQAFEEAAKLIQSECDWAQDTPRSIWNLIDQKAAEELAKIQGTGE